MAHPTIDDCLHSPIIPVVWDPAPHLSQVALGRTVLLQGGTLDELPRVLEMFGEPALAHLAVLVHIDLIAGLENNEAGLKYLARFDRISGVVTIHHHLVRPARKLGMLSIVRFFLSDSRALERGLAVAEKAKPDAIEILPAAIAINVARDFRRCSLPRIAGGLCRTEKDIREVLASGCRAVTSTRPDLWRLNRLPAGQ